MVFCEKQHNFQSVMYSSQLTKEKAIPLNTFHTHANRTEEFLLSMKQYRNYIHFNSIHMFLLNLTTFASHLKMIVVGKDCEWII